MHTTYLHVNFALDLIVTLTFVNDKVTVTVEYHPDGLPASRKHTLCEYKVGA